MRVSAADRRAKAAWLARIRRDRNRASGRCVNENAAGTHGPATHGVRCERCDAVEREEAADACAMMASSNAEKWASAVPKRPAYWLGHALDRASRAGQLVFDVLDQLPGHELSEDEERERWAEAEARLRCGWLPGDEQ